MLYCLFASMAPARTLRPSRRILFALAITLARGNPCHSEEPAVRSGEPLPSSRSLRTVVLDPGHGGEDAGVTGPSGTMEKDIAADICRRTARIFGEQLGTQRVVITRDEEGDVANRTSLANGSKGNVLVSIHVAFSCRPEEHGARVYTMSPGLRVVELAERRLRPRARRTVRGLTDEPSDLRLTPWAMAQQEYLGPSQSLAARISAELASIAGTAPIASLPIAVLSGARMPAVLVEVGYLSNPEEEERLRSDRYRELLARAIFRGIVGFGYGGAIFSDEPPTPPQKPLAVEAPPAPTSDSSSPAHDDPQGAPEEPDR